MYWRRCARSDHAKLRMGGCDNRSKKRRHCWPRPRQRAPVIAKAGGMDLLDLMKEGIVQPARVVNLRRIRSLGDVRLDGTGMQLGALVTLAQIARDAGDSVALSRAGGGGVACGDASGQECGDHRRQLIATAALLVFQERSLSSAREGRPQRASASRDLRECADGDGACVDAGDCIARVRRKRASRRWARIRHALWL